MNSEITVLLARYRDGDDAAFDKLSRALYPELKALANRRARGNVMGATTLVQETYARYLSGGTLEPANRKEFFSLAATIMRRIIIDDVRKAQSAKHGAETTRDVEPIDENQPSPQVLLAVDRELDRLTARDPRLKEVFECRYFAGYTTAETADILDLSPRTVERLWNDTKSSMTVRLR